MASGTADQHLSTGPSHGQSSLEDLSLEGLSLEELRQEALESYQEATAGGTLHYSLWATLRAGRFLLELKARCKHGEFSAIKDAEGVNPMKASRFMRLAESPNLTHCVNYQDCQEVVDRNEWRSMRNVLEVHGLVSPPSKTKVSEAVSGIEVEDVELCRYSGGYLVRVSAGTDPSVVAQRVEFAAETKDPTIARLIRDAVYRAFEAIKVLPPRSKSKWQAYRAKEGKPESDDDGILLSADSELLKAYQQRVRDFDLEEVFSDLLPA